MYSQDSLMDVARLRLQLQMNNRLRLELQAAMSRVFREHSVVISDELLASLILSVPEELLGQGDALRVFAQSRRRDGMHDFSQASQQGQLLMSSLGDPPPVPPPIPPPVPPPVPPPIPQPVEGSDITTRETGQGRKNRRSGKRRGGVK